MGKRGSVGWLVVTVARRCGRWSCVVALLAWLGIGHALAADAADPSDLWWNPSESGWGMQLVRGGEVTFATLFVYDAASRPTFYSATLSASGATWSGTLYETDGPYFASVPFDPDKVAARAVGSLAFAQATADSGQLQYSVNSKMVTKNVTRQTLRFDDYSGSYPLAVQRVTTHCSDAAANGDRIAMETIAIGHQGTVITLDWTSAQRTCHYAGAYMQTGKLGAAQTSYSCSDGENGDIAFFELTKRNGFIAGRFQGHAIDNACDHRGQFAGFLPD